jgi:hypothetical protein
LVNGAVGFSLAMPVAAMAMNFSAPPISTRATAGLAKAWPASASPGTVVHSGVGPTTAPLVVTVSVTSSAIRLLPPAPLPTSAAVPKLPSALR